VAQRPWISTSLLRPIAKDIGLTMKEFLGRR
jgi:hypothetical protein